jgi:hypothetical protein
VLIDVDDDTSLGMGTREMSEMGRSQLDGASSRILAKNWFSTTKIYAIPKILYRA